jgi:excisionase family DNA binding protein
MSASPDHEILNIEEAAALLGVSVKTFNKVLHGEDLPARKIGREWKFSRRALINWVGSGHSCDFYRDSSDGRELSPVPRRRRDAASDSRDSEDGSALERRQDQVAGSARDHEGRDRRTAGWRIELD